MPLSDDFLYRLKAANRIDEVMSSYVSLQRAGRYMKCNCPFHSEKTPSCVVYPDTESFYCFGCGAGGDVITFVMRISNLSYIEAVRLLAERAGIPMPEDVARGDDFSQRKQRIYEMNKKAARFFFENLRGEKGLAARQYLKKRGLVPETITKYGIGFANTGWTTLRDYMYSEGYSEKELIDASLIVRSSRTGGTYDFFMNRVMFPFIDLQGHIVGFGGRTLDPNDQRKYLNTKETIAYKKSGFLFSMNFAKASAAKTKRLLLCEGNMDVISLNQAGFENSVATCGTAITDEHARLISQYCDEVVICYDADSAGRKASDKAIGMLSQVGVNTKVINMEGAKDPDEYILKYGKERFAYLLDNSDGAISYNLKRCMADLDMDSEIGKVNYLKRACEVLADIPNKVEREVYISKVSAEQGISKTALTENVDGIISGRKRRSSKKEWQQTITSFSAQTDPKSGEPTEHNRITKAQEGIIAYIVANPDSISDVFQRLSPEVFPTHFLKQLYESIVRRAKNSLSLELSSFNEEFDTSQMGRISRIFNLNRDMPVDSDTAEDYIRLLNENAEEVNSSSDDIDLGELALKKRKKLK